MEETGQVCDDPCKVFGDEMLNKDENDLRIISCNINGFAKTNITTMDQSKNKLLFELIRRTQTDLILTQEDNVFWPKMHSEDTPKERCKGWRRDMKIISAFNTDDREVKGHHLQGGTSVYVFDEISHRCQTQTGVDQTLLGRWSWIQLSGRNGVITRIYSAYRPCHGQGEHTVYSQQVRALLAKNDTRCPQTAFWEDLHEEIQAAKQEGIQIIIGGDFNCDLSKEVTSNFMTELGLYNVVFELHGDQGPNTFARGSSQIDGIYASTTIQVKKSGYMPLLCAVGDHRPLWMDINVTSIVGEPEQGHLPRNARRLRIDDTRCKMKYVQQLTKTIKEERLHILAENKYDEGRSNQQPEVCEYLSLIHI